MCSARVSVCSSTFQDLGPAASSALNPKGLEEEELPGRPERAVGASVRGGPGLKTRQHSSCPGLNSGPSVYQLGDLEQVP